MKNVVYGFFDDKSGTRIGRLQIESVDIEYQRHGFLRVAWDPLVVLDGVTLEIDAGAKWPEAGAKIIDALRVAGRQNASVLRHVRVRIAGSSGCEITATTATLRKDGGLEMSGVNLTPAASPADSFDGDFCFWLAGPRAGEWTHGDSPAGALAQTSSLKRTLAHPAP